MSKYLKIMEARKVALKKGDDAGADKLFRAAQKLARDGKVTKEEALGASYL